MPLQVDAAILVHLPGSVLWWQVVEHGISSPPTCAPLLNLLKLMQLLLAQVVGIGGRRDKKRNFLDWWFTSRPKAMRMHNTAPRWACVDAYQPTVLLIWLSTLVDSFLWQQIRLV